MVRYLWGFFFKGFATAVIARSLSSLASNGLNEIGLAELARG